VTSAQQPTGIGSIGGQNDRPLRSDAGPIKRLIADKVYYANSLSQLLADRGAKVVIPSTMSRRQPIPYNKTIYRQRNHA
jgi:transposase